MKRQRLIKRPRAAGRVFIRSGGRHDVYMNPKTHKKQPEPRHSEIGEDLARQILKILG